MKEIGGYMEFEHFCGKEYHNKLLRFNTVRNSIEYIIKIRRYSKIFIPYYLCHSVSDMLNKASIQYNYYNIDKNLLPIINTHLQTGEAILVVNYFGFLDLHTLLELKKRYTNIILDNTHAFFELPIEEIDTVYTCRKFFGVPDGAYLSTSLQSEEYFKLEQDHSYLRMSHLLGRFENCAQEYYSEFCKNDEALANQNIKRMSSITRNILCGIDYKSVKSRREKNYNILKSHFEKMNLLEFKHTGLYMYPFLHHKGAHIKKALISKKIYIPTLWPNVLRNCSNNSWEFLLASNLILLPIDQRYNEKDMDYVSKTLKSLI